MGEICAFAEEHVGEVSALFLRGMRGRKDAPVKALQDYFREIFFTNPWASPEFPSLVYFDRGKLVGFLGVMPRQMEFRGRKIRVAVTSQLVVDREQHRGLAALELLRRYMRGPQDLSFCDGVSESVDKLWMSAGASPSRLYSFNWLRMLRPFGTGRSFADRLHGPLRIVGRAISAAAGPADFLVSKLPHPALRPPRSECVSTELNADEMYRLMQEVGWREALRPSYQLSDFQWLMAQVALNRPLGDLRMTAVHQPDGDLCGYHICLVQRGGHATALQIGVRRHDLFDKVLGALFRDVWQHGASSVKGQAIPWALVNLTEHYCLFRQPNTSVLFQARDPEIQNAIFRGDAALSRLDGEYCLRFATEAWR
jgi:hypothetical protein